MKIKKEDIEKLDNEIFALELESKYNIVTLGLFWSTINFNSNSSLAECRRLYDERTRKRDCDFARTLVLLEKEPKGSKLWNLIIKNAKMHLKEEKKEKGKK